MKRFGTLLCTGLTLLLTTPVALPAQSTTQQAAAPQTLAAHWRQVQDSLARGQTPAALAVLDSMAAHFGSEPEYLAAQPRLLPLHARLLLTAGRPAEAAQLFRRWLDLPQTQALTTERTAILGSLAEACEQIADTAAAQAALEELIRISPNLPQRQLAQLRLATLAARATTNASEREEATAQLQSLALAEDYPLQLREQARLQAIFLHLQNHEPEQAASILLGQRWSVNQMPQIGQLSFAALQIAIAMLREEQPQTALAALRYVAPAEELLHLQQTRRDWLANTLAQQQRRDAEGSLTAAATSYFLKAQLLQADALLQRLRQDSTLGTTILLTRASAYLQDGSPWQAAIILQELCRQLQAEETQNTSATAGTLPTTSPQSPPPNLQPPPNSVRALQQNPSGLTLPQARYRYLLALRQAHREETLQEAAVQFAEAYAGNPLSHQAHYLMIESLRRQKNYTRAIAYIDQLLTQIDSAGDSPNHHVVADHLLPSTDALRDYPTNAISKYPRGLLYIERGYCNALLGRYDAARKDFSQTVILTQTADDLLRGWAQYWLAQTDLLAADYPQAMQNFAVATQQTNSGHPAHAHVWLGLAQATYGAGDSTAARAAIEKLLQEFVDYPQRAQAQLLLAETLISLSQTEQALTELDLLAEQAEHDKKPELKARANFRSAEIFEQLGQLNRAIAVYDDYIYKNTNNHITLNKTIAKNSTVSATRRPEENAAATQSAQATPATETHDSASEQAHSLKYYSTAALRVARLYERSSNTDQAATTLLQALLEQGNNADSGDYEKIIALAHRLGLQPQSIGADHQDEKKLHMRPAQQAVQSYPDWLSAAVQQAQQNKRPTLAARLRFALSEHYRRLQQDDLQNALLLQIARETPPQAMDTRTLEAVSRLLCEKDFVDAKIYSNELASRFSKNELLPPSVYWNRAQLLLHSGNAAAVLEQLDRITADWPLHTLLPEAVQLKAQLYTESGDSTAALHNWQHLLELTRSTPAQRTHALLQIARIHAARGEAPTAIAHYQRIYTLYRAEPQALTTAYLESALLFESIGDTEAALATYSELLATLEGKLAPAQLEQAHVSQQRLAALQKNVAQDSPTTAPRPLDNSSKQTIDVLPQQDTARFNPAAGNNNFAIVNNERRLPRTTKTALPPKKSVAKQNALAPQQLATHTADAIATDTQNPWQALPSEPVYIHLTHGAKIEADIIGIENGYLHLRLREQGNRIGETAVALEQINHIDFGDAERWKQADAWQMQGDAARAYAGRKQLYIARERALEFNDLPALSRFTDLAEDALQHGDPLFAVRIAKRCSALMDSREETQSKSEGAKADRSSASAGSTAANNRALVRYQQPAITNIASRLADTELLSLQQLGLPLQAASRAAEIILHTSVQVPLELLESDPQTFAAITDLAAASQLQSRSNAAHQRPRSALPYAILAAHAIEHGKSETALELALYPIVFEDHLQPTRLPHIAEAYAQAAAAATIREDFEFAQKLRTQAHSLQATQQKQDNSLTER